MKITIKNLGPLRQAEFSLGDLTIICGQNNTGKTYATYALFGFLQTWRDMLSISISEVVVDCLLTEGSTSVDVGSILTDASKILEFGCQMYSSRLPSVFAAAPERFKDSEFSVSVNLEQDLLNEKYEHRIKSATTDLFTLSKQIDSPLLQVTLLVSKGRIQIPKDAISRVITDALKEIVFGKIFPRPFIASAERTGAAIFRKELNFAKNRILEELGQKSKSIDPFDLLTKAFDDYALPVKVNVDFTRDIESIAKQSSFIAEEHPGILGDFADIIGGEYTVTRNDELYYVPKGKKIKLSMDESSSAVRSLLDIGFYLRNVAQRGDLLMVDEPELNLHPENQRRVARLFARLVHLGIKVFITTHSDYIIKELNTLIMLHQDKPHLKAIAEREGYRREELLEASGIKVYIAEEAPVMVDGGKRKIRCQTLTPADIQPDVGIEARSFDSTIEKMNQIQEEIIWADR